MAANRTHDAGAASGSGHVSGDESIYTHPYTTQPPRRVHFNEELQFADVPDWHTTATSSSSSASPLLIAKDKLAQLGGVIPVPSRWSAERDNLPSQSELNVRTHQPHQPQQPLQGAAGHAHDRFTRIAQAVLKPAAPNVAAATMASSSKIGTPHTPHTPYPPASAQLFRSTPSPPQSHRTSQSPSAPRTQQPSPPRAAVNATAGKFANRPSPLPVPVPSLNTLLRPHGGVTVDFIADPSSTTVVLTDQTGSPRAHYSPPRAPANVDRNSLPLVPLKAYQREQPATSPPVTKMRVLLPSSIGAHHHNRHAEAANAAFDSNYGPTDGSIDGAGPMIVVVNSRVAGAPLTVGDLLDMLRAVLMTGVTQVEWARASTPDRTVATEAFYARISQAPDREREIVRGVRRIDWCGRESWFGGLEAVTDDGPDSELTDGTDVTWRLVMRAGAADALTA